MLDSEAYQLVTTASHHQGIDEYIDGLSGKIYDVDAPLQAALRRQYPELALTVTIDGNVNLLRFAFAGYATATLDIVDEAVLRTRVFLRPSTVAESRTFAKYHYKWGDEHFIVYVVRDPRYYGSMQYIFKDPGEGETVMSRNAKTDELIKTIGIWQIPPPPGDKFVYVYDGYWMRSRVLYDQIKDASWDDVILNEAMKKEITQLMHRFFDSRDIYKNLGVPWKRGVIFHGPAGNGKTISIKALMNSLFRSDGLTIPSLYVKSCKSTYAIRTVFQQARYMSPCLLIFEDIDTVVTDSTRSYFFNEVDGLENNDGIFMVASTNHLDKLDAGLSSRPSRFDRKYLFPLPSEEERNLYCQYWRERLKARKVEIEFPMKICPAMALITEDFSFAYLQEAFVATLLAIAQRRSESVDLELVTRGDSGLGGGDDGDKDLNEYELWRELKKTIRALREDMGKNPGKTVFGDDPLTVALALEKETQAPDAGNESPSTPQAQAMPLRQPAYGKPERQDQAMPFRQAIDEKPETKQKESLHVQGKVLELDHQNVPIITDDNSFVHKRE